MTNTKEKPGKEQRVQIKTRQPGPVQPSGFTQLRRHADLDSVDTVAEILSLPSEPSAGATAEELPRPSTPSRASTVSTRSRPSTPSTPSRGSTQSRGSTSTGDAQPELRPTSPPRDFTKFPNSVVRDAIPAGLFGDQGGKAMELYSALWKETRGAVIPRRQVRIPKDRLMQLSGIASEMTLRKNLQKLRGAGLVIETVIRGERGGNMYEVFQPEEIGLAAKTTPSTPSIPSTLSITPQNLEGLEALDARDSTPGANAGTQSISGGDNTFSLRQGENDDDEATAPLLRAMKGDLGRRVESAPLAELFELLAAEFKIAEGRTGLVSNPAAFFLEHMRRRLWKTKQLPAEREGKSAIAASVPSVKVDPSNCPDCFGTGMHYPEGFDKGVARCRHENLTASSVPAASATAAPAPAAQPPTDGDLVEVAVGFLHQGMDIEAIGQLLSASIDAEEWPRVRAAALERYERERGQMRPPDKA